MSRTFYASTYVIADGVTRTWPFSFAGVNGDHNSGTTPYLYPEDVKVSESYTDSNGVKQTVARSGTLSMPNQLTIDGPAVILGREIRIYRETELRFPLVDYRDLQSVSEHDLDLANRQAVYLAQEVRDAASANLLQDDQGNYDAKGRRIVNLASAIEPTDAVNKNDLDTAIKVVNAFNDRAIVFPEGERGQVLPAAIQRANKLMVTGADGLIRFDVPNPDGAQDLIALLASKEGAGYIGTLAGNTVQEAMDNLKGRLTNVRSLAIRGDGSDEGVKLQRALDTGLHLYFPAGRYVSSKILNPLPGQWFVGDEGSQFTPGSRRTVIASMFPNTALFATTQSVPGQLAAPRWLNMHLQSDYPIVLNDPLAQIIDTSGTTPYWMKHHIVGVDLSPITPGTGIGLSLSKCFDGIIEACDITGFDINILMNGCDLNTVRLNRVRAATRYNILETSAQTFGSQNFIEHNDILQTKAGGVSYGSSSRHTVFVRNYLEQTSPCKGFVDLGSVELPQFGTNKQGLNYTTIVEGNRIDGQHHATDFVYRLNPRGVFVKLHDLGTVGPSTHPANKGLVIVGDTLPLLYNALNGCRYDFQGPRFGKWDGFVTAAAFTPPGTAFAVNSRNLVHMDGLYGNTAFAGLGLRGDVIVMKKAATKDTTWTLPVNHEINNPYLAEDDYYIVTLRARTLADTDDFKMMITAGAVPLGAANRLTLGKQFTDFVYTIPGTSVDKRIGVTVGRYTANGDIEIQDITVKRGILRRGVVAHTGPREVQAGKSHQPSVTVQGSKRGEFAKAIFSGNASGFMVSAYVHTDGFAQVTFFNPTAGNLVLDTGTITVEVTK